MDVLRFNNLQLHYLRLGLNTYKVCRNLTWLLLAEEVIRSHTNEYDFPEDNPKLESLRDEDTSGIRKKDDAGWPIQYQDLRRFVDGVPDHKTKQRKLKGLSQDKLIAVHDFLKSEKFLPHNFDVIEDGSSAISIATMMDFFEQPPQSLSSNGIPDLTGNYEGKYQQDDIDIKIHLTFTPSSSETCYQIEELGIFYKKGTALKVNEMRMSGLAFTPSDNVFSFLKEIFPKSSKKHKKTYIVRQLIKVAGQNAYDLEVQDISNSLSIIKKDEEGEDRSINFSLKNSQYSILIDDKKRKDNVVNLFDKNKKVSGFGAGQVAAHPWAQYKEKLKGTDKKKDEPLSHDELNKAFLDAALWGKFWLIPDQLAKGADINATFENSETRAIHVAARYNALPTIEELGKYPDLNYLVLDEENRLPSFYAAMVALNPELRDFLVEKEKAEAEAQGLDYEKIATLHIEP